MSGFVDDLSVFFIDFGEDVVLFPGEAGERTIQGIYDSDHLEVSELTQTPISTRQPMVDVIESEITDLEAGHRVTVRGIIYQITAIHPHDAGLAWLILRIAQ